MYFVQISLNQRILNESDFYSNKKFIYIVVEQFVGSLSLHFNHFIAWHVLISHQQFGTLPFGICFGPKTP